MYTGRQESQSVVSWSIIPEMCRASGKTLASVSSQMSIYPYKDMQGSLSKQFGAWGITCIYSLKTNVIYYLLMFTRFCLNLVTRITVYFSIRIKLISFFSSRIKLHKLVMCSDNCKMLFRYPLRVYLVSPVDKWATRKYDSLW